MMRTPEMHSNHIGMPGDGTFQSATYGVKGNYPINALNYSITTGLPPHVAYDVLEMIVSYELAVCLAAQTENYFLAEELNKKIANFSSTHHDSVNKPQLIRPKFMASKIKQKITKIVSG